MCVSAPTLLLNGFSAFSQALTLTLALALTLTLSLPLTLTLTLTWQVFLLGASDHER